MKNEIIAIQNFFATYWYFLDLQDKLYGEDGPGLSESKIILLRTVSDSSGISIKDLASKLKISKPSVSVMVDKLVHEGWLVKKQNEKDKRGVCILMNDKGKEKIKQLKRKMITAIKPAFEKLNDEELSQFVVLLKKLQT